MVRYLRAMQAALLKSDSLRSCMNYQRCQRYLFFDRETRQGSIYALNYCTKTGETNMFSLQYESPERNSFGSQSIVSLIQLMTKWWFSIRSACRCYLDEFYSRHIMNDSSLILVSVSFAACSCFSFSKGVARPELCALCPGVARPTNQVMTVWLHFHGFSKA